MQPLWLHMAHKEQTTILYLSFMSKSNTSKKFGSETTMKYKIYYDPQIQYPELFQIRNIMFEVSSGKTWETSKPKKNWIYAEIEADNPTQAIQKLLQLSF